MNGWYAVVVVLAVLLTACDGADEVGDGIGPVLVTPRPPPLIEDSIPSPGMSPQPPLVEEIVPPDWAGEYENASTSQVAPAYSSQVTGVFMSGF